jgi:hypothetical protein
MRGVAILVLAGAALAACQPNPRNEIAGVAQAAMAQAVADAPGKALCVERAVAPWRPAAQVRRIDTPAPPGFASLRGEGVFRGGGGLRGDEVAGVAVRGGMECFQLRGPLVAGDRAMLEVGQPGIGWNVWLRKTQADWRVVMTTTSVYPNGS